MSSLLSAASKIGEVGSRDMDDMTVSFQSDVKLYYNDKKKAYDLEIWHGNVNPYLHDADVCVQLLHQLSLKDSSRLITWAKDGLITLTSDGRIDTVRFSVRGIDDTFMAKTDGKYLVEKETAAAWSRFLDDNVSAISRLMVSEMYGEYADWLKEHAETYHIKEAGEKVLCAVHLEPWMLRIHFNIVHDWDDDEAMRIYKHNFAGIGFYIYAGENVAYCWSNMYGAETPEETKVLIPSNLEDVLKIAVN